MEDRYELRGKIGQGGIGRVYRAYDHKMNREVAIKRILTSADDPSLRDEATKQLMVESGALSSLQHPNIVIIHDVGSDDEGPYVVMELINGKTLDEIIENAPLTWDDFRQVAMQSLEALVAAQEIEMIHSDLKPPNIMLTWLPSGTFQVKLVDFGLAVLAQEQSQEEIDNMDTVFGSIFFMPPEQFERKTLDTRSDLYSLGCCLYQSLAGTYPFNGETGTEVMEAHLNHTVQPLQEIRNDIPVWACQWVMWLINREREDRPESAREALANFEENDKLSNPAMSHGGAGVKRPRLILATDIPVAPLTRLTTATATVEQTAVSPQEPASPLPETAAPQTQANRIRASISGIKFSGKHLKIGIAAALTLLIGLMGMMLKKRNDRIRLENVYHHILATAAKDDVLELPISGNDLRTVLEFIAASPAGSNLSPAFDALVMAKATDGTHIDTVIADFTTTAEMPAKIRQALFEKVIGERRESAVIPILLEYAAATAEPEMAVTAIRSIDGWIQEQHAPELITLLSKTGYAEISMTVDPLLGRIIRNSAKRERLADLISGAEWGQAIPASQKVMRQLLEQCEQRTQPAASTPTVAVKKPAQAAEKTNPVPSPDDPEAVKQLQAAFASGDDAQKKAALQAVSSLAEEPIHRALLNITGQAVHDDAMLTAIIKTMIQINSLPGMPGNDATGRWKQILWRVKTDEQRIMLIEAAAKFEPDLQRGIITGVIHGASPEVVKIGQQKLNNLENP